MTIDSDISSDEEDENGNKILKLYKYNSRMIADEINPRPEYRKMAELTKEGKLRIEKERQERDKLKEFKPAGPKAPKEEADRWAAFD